MKNLPTFIFLTVSVSTITIVTVLCFIVLVYLFFKLAVLKEYLVSGGLLPDGRPVTSKRIKTALANSSISEVQKQKLLLLRKFHLLHISVISLLTLFYIYEIIIATQSK